jgi:hypothetical protein
MAGLSDECDNFIKAQTRVPYAKQKRWLMNQFDLLPKVKKSIDYKEVFYKKYPLLGSLSHYSSSKPEHIVEYINLIEGK